MVKKRVLFLGILILIGLVYLVMALPGDGAIIVSPSSGSNFTTLSGVLFNISFNNGTDITDPSNATFFLNISGTWSRIGSTSASNGCQVNQTISSCAVNITNSTIPDGIYSINATIYNSTSSTSINNLSNLSNIIYIDNTKPMIFAENITNPLSGKNYSQNLVLNVSAIDALIGMGTVIFNITNNTNNQNATITATREGLTSNYAITINTSHYPDGYYNLTVYANDTVGNLNNSALVYRIIFDNTAPTVTHSCDDYIVVEDETIACTCTATDATAGLNLSYETSGVSFTASPSTSSTGNNKQTTCASQDKANNIRTSTLYYNVTSRSSSSSATSSGGSTTSSTSSANSSSNATSSNTVSQDANNDANNTLQGNQDNSGTPDVKSKTNIWIIAGIIFAIGLGITVYSLMKKHNFKMNAHILTFLRLRR